MDTIQAMLDRLADMQCQLDLINAHYVELRRSLIPPEIQAALEELEAEQATAAEAAQAGIAQLTEQIKLAVISRGASVRGAHLQAVWSKPRVTWDTARLDDYASTHPELLNYRRQGTPGVSIRVIRRPPRG